MSINQKLVGLKELRENLESYITLVKKGMRFTVLRRSKPVFVISPVVDDEDEDSWETVIDFTKFKKGGISAKELIKRLF